MYNAQEMRRFSLKILREDVARIIANFVVHVARKTNLSPTSIPLQAIRGTVRRPFFEAFHVEVCYISCTW